MQNDFPAISANPLIPIHDPVDNLQLALASFQKGEDQAVELFTDAFSIFQKSIERYNSTVEELAESFKEISGKVSHLDLRSTERDEKAISEDQKRNDEINKLSVRLDEVATKANSLSGKIAEEENRRLKLQAEFALVQKDQMALIANYRSYVLTQEQKSLNNNFAAVASRKEEVSQIIASTQKQCEALTTRIEKTETEVMSLTTTYSVHRHIFTIPGSCAPTYSSGPNK